ncbi:hypothetical protein AX15_003436 [Amanita polypyramis BW_CC]|nr:hypothetical protein AX15_003436 [Amanita polypyramis BW_CC]
MSVRYNRPPVTEIPPPIVFMFHETAMPGAAYTVLLWKSGHHLTVQFPGPTDPPKDLYDHLHAEIKQLRSHANSLIFGKTNWVYFVRNRDGKRALVYRQRPKRRIPYTPFAQVVHESEFTHVRPVLGRLVEGIWRGQQVDAYLGADDLSHGYIEAQLRAYELLRGLDLTYEILAHLVDSDGNLTGLLCEPAFGRPFQATDILALHDAIRQINDRGLYWYLDPDNVMLTYDNKIRLLNYRGLRKFRSDKEKEEQWLIWQKILHEIYLSYKNQYHPHSSHRYVHIRPRVIDATPPLEWGFGIFSTIQLSTDMKLHPFAGKNVPLSVRRLSYRARSDLSSPLSLAETTGIEEVNDFDDTNTEEDKPILRPDHRSRRDRRSKSSWPYDPSSRKSRKLLLAPE